ncbi:MAG: hypothetical protein ACR2MC_11300 [Actinomycetota bacterium]
MSDKVFVDTNVLNHVEIVTLVMDYRIGVTARPRKVMQLIVLH